MTLNQGLTVSKAGKKLRINASNAKVIVRNGRKLLQQAKIEAESTVKVEPDVKTEFVEAESGAKLNENVPEMTDPIPYDMPIFFWPGQVPEYSFSMVMVPFPSLIWIALYFSTSLQNNYSFKISFREWD